MLIRKTITCTDFFKEETQKKEEKGDAQRKVESLFSSMIGEKCTLDKILDDWYVVNLPSPIAWRAVQHTVDELTIIGLNLKIVSFESSSGIHKLPVKIQLMNSLSQVLEALNKDPARKFKV